MGINSILENALIAPWCLTDDFSFYYSNNMMPFEGIAGLSPNDSLDIAVINVDTPQLSADVTTTLVAGRWRTHSTKFQPFTFSVTFRDVAGMPLKNFFINVWAQQQKEYFDDAKSTVKISSAGSTVFSTEYALISSVSTSQFDNNNTAVAEFTVEFLSPTYDFDGNMDNSQGDNNFSGINNSNEHDSNGGFNLGGNIDLGGGFNLGGEINVGLGGISGSGGFSGNGLNIKTPSFNTRGLNIGQNSLGRDFVSISGISKYL